MKTINIIHFRTLFFNFLFVFVLYHIHYFIQLLNSLILYNTDKITEISYHNSLLEYQSYIPSQFHYYDMRNEEKYFLRKFGNPFNYTSIGYNYPVVNYWSDYSIKAKPVFDKHYYLLVMYLSAAGESNFRDIVRKTMKSINNSNITFCFVVASNENYNSMVLKESNYYNDILLLNHLDDYINLTISVISAFNYFSRHQVAEYILKTDTDCAVNFDMLLPLLHTLNTKSHTYLGNCMCGEHFTFRRRYDPPREFIGDNLKLPCYSYGGGYALSMHSLPTLMIAIRHLDYLLINEDINIGKAWALLNNKCTFVKNWLLLRPKNQDLNQYYIIHTKGNYTFLDIAYKALSLIKSES